MDKKELNISYRVYKSSNELPERERRLLEKAFEASGNAYAKYSNFNVGAALLLDNGVIVTGSNQENAAYPSGLCAERTAMFHAGSQYPEASMLMLAIVAVKDGAVTDKPAFPCGACRQVMMEYQRRSGKPMQIVIGGLDEIIVFDGADALLPFAFSF